MSEQFTISMRKACLMDALQAWLTRQCPDFVLVDVKTYELHRVELIVQDRRRPKEEQK